MFSGTPPGMDAGGYKAVRLLAAGPYFTDPAWLFGWKTHKGK
jgi:hypothetical protein